MKKTLILLLSISVFTNCKNESKSKDAQIIEEQVAEQKLNETSTLSGEFVFYEGAAVLQTKDEIYGVFITDKAKELNQMAEKYKTEPTDMVLVDIKGKISNKKDDKILWENKVEITEILGVKPLPKADNNVVKLGQE